MRLSVAQEIAAPVEAVWTDVADVERLESLARQRDPGLRRVPDGPVGPGTRWELAVPVQGRRRRVTLELLEMTSPDVVRMRATVEGVALTSDLTFTALSADRTRMALAVEGRSSGLAGRVLLGALSVARPTVERRMRERLAIVAKRIELRKGSDRAP